MKHFILLFVFSIITCFAYSQFHNATSAASFKYKEVGDTIFVNNKYFVPGDTLFLNQGSAPDKSFVGIYEQVKVKVTLIPSSGNLKYLSSQYNGGYLIFEGRKQIKGAGFKVYEPLFYDPSDKKKKRYIVLFYHAIGVNELKGF